MATAGSVRSSPAGAAIPTPETSASEMSTGAVARIGLIATPLLSLGQSSVAPAVVQEGLATLIFAGHDLAYEDFVVAAR